jgi:hypothetical protein
VQFEELAEQVAKHSKPGYLDAESIAKVKTRIASCRSTALLVTEKVVEAAPPELPPSPPIDSHRIRDPSPSLPPETNEEKEGHRPPP